MEIPVTRLPPLVWQMEKSLKCHDLMQASLFVAVSGGRDSVALMHMMWLLWKKHSFEMFFCHVHHGESQKPSEASEQENYRREAFCHVRDLAEFWKVPFLSNATIGDDSRLEFISSLDSEGEGEAELRKYRYGCLEEMKNRVQARSTPVVVMAHHAEDLLETRLHRLIRGTGPEGLVSMRERDEFFWRPLLKFSSDELQGYVESQGLNWVEDPSNQECGPFRNWLRQKWLMELEAKSPGAKRRLAQSLELLSQDRSPIDLGEFFEKDAIIAPSFSRLEKLKQREVLVSYMKRKNMKNYGQSHVEEILKRLDTPQKRHRFRVLKHEWVITPEMIWAVPVTLE